VGSRPPDGRRDAAGTWHHDFATGAMARRGIEPAMAAAYAVFFLETVGAVMIIFGLFTRFFAAALAVEFAIITFVAH
jgi:putative oxidoreductase